MDFCITRLVTGQVLRCPYPSVKLPKCPWNNLSHSSLISNHLDLTPCIICTVQPQVSRDFSSNLQSHRSHCLTPAGHWLIVLLQSCCRSPPPSLTCATQPSRTISFPLPSLVIAWLPSSLLRPPHGKHLNGLVFYFNFKTTLNSLFPPSLGRASSYTGHNYIGIGMLNTNLNACKFSFFLCFLVKIWTFFMFSFFGCLIFYDSI